MAKSCRIVKKLSTPSNYRDGKKRMLSSSGHGDDRSPFPPHLISGPSCCWGWVPGSSCCCLSEEWVCGLHLHCLFNVSPSFHQSYCLWERGSVSGTQFSLLYVLLMMHTLRFQLCSFIQDDAVKLTASSESLHRVGRKGKHVQSRFYFSLRTNLCFFQSGMPQDPERGTDLCDSP